MSSDGACERGRRPRGVTYDRIISNIDGPKAEDYFKAVAAPAQATL